MESIGLPEWKASWIWGSGPQSPRNEWRCFRRAVTPQGKIGQASLRITADSRYVLFVGGKQIGRGPVRSWPFELAYDEYEVGHLLEPGKETVIAVLVMHYGISTFQYVRGRGGLLLQLDAHDGDPLTLSTDSSWRTSVHPWYDSSSSRISCQLGFTEVVDARNGDGSWTEAGYDDSRWEQAVTIGPAGMEPWTKLIKRPIPYLTEEPVYPARVESISAVKPPVWSAVLDLRGIMVPESAEHANNVQFIGYVAANVRLKKSASFTIGIADNGRIPYKLYIDGRLCEAESFFGEHPERFVTLPLEEGEHFLLIDVSAVSHGHGFHIGFDCSEPFEVSSPDGGDAPFTAIGPFGTAEFIDHRPGRGVTDIHSDFERIRGVSSAEQLQPFEAWIRPIEPRFVNRNDVFTASVWKVREQTHSVPASMQHAVIAGPDSAWVPAYDGMDTEIVIDFGRELSGYVSFELDAAAGTVVDGYGFEYMKDGWRQQTYELDNTFRYTCREGRQSYTSFVRRGLRYVALTFRSAQRPVKLYEVKLLQSNYPVAEVGKFRSSDALLNDIWSISRDTARLCMEDTFVDCPAYEQAFWVGDARNEALVNYYAFGAQEIVERCLKLVPGSSFQTPLYADQVPSGWNSVIPNWTFFWVSACREYYRYNGNPAFIADIWPHVKLTLTQYLSKMNEQGLFVHNGWNLLDWAPFEQPWGGVVTPQNMFFVKALREGAEIGALAGDTEQAERFADAAVKLREAIDTYLWDPAREAYLDCIHADGKPSATLSAQSQIVAYLCDIPAGDRKTKVEQYVVNPPASFVQVGSPFMSFFYYEALAKLGRLDILMNDLRQNYGFMIENDATSCWEMYPWSGHVTNPNMLTRSHCHAWSAGPAYFLGAYVLGVQGLAPGWSSVRVSPQPCGLQWASGSVPLPHDGRIDVAWRVVEEGKLSLRIEAPKHVDIVAEAPDGWEMTVERRVV
ncbi:family 78 glycoside hydrolase catalytic domain [Paenibacillus thermotolerans]|uniref:family 78 glycoside hydrolase catalytic domain n=1 Tax=Paenibacillus thermotolerans TaxID=3027807 RepID=UPI0023681910|nr:MULTISPECIES: family 78 glycoside hydrolase catalytic domain [unclassified Paenibacillus]